MAAFTNTIDLFGDEIVAGKIVEKTIEEFNDDSITVVGKYAFYDCYALTSINLPFATSIAYAAFNGCRVLKSIDFPQVKSIGSNAFFNCSALKTADFSNATNIATYSFYLCSAFDTLILRSTTMCTLANTNAFASTFISSGTLYVPQALITQYQQATNWSSIYAAGCKFLAIEGSEYE